MHSVLYSRPDDADEEVEEEEGTLQRRAFPVAEGAAGDESSPPENGLEYLRRVRSQQQQLPATVIAHIDPGRMKKTQGSPSSTLPKGSILGTLASAPIPPPPLPKPLQPRAAWQLALLDRFRALRKQLQHGDGEEDVATASRFPDAGDGQAWETFCFAGRNSASASSAARLPTPRLLRALTPAQCAGLLQAMQGVLARSNWSSFIEQPRTADASVDDAGRWVFAAMASLRDDVLLFDANLAAAVRGIYMTSLTLRARLLGLLDDNTSSEGREGADAGSAREVPSDGGQGGAGCPVLGPEAYQKQLASLNVLITLAGGVFKQGPSEEWMGAE